MAQPPTLNQPTTPLDWRTKIVNPDGTPNNYFIRLWQTVYGNSGNASQDIATIKAEITALEDAALQAGTGINITPDGKLLSNPTIKLANTVVTPGTYGDATHVGQFTVDQQGRLTAASNVAISGGGGGGGTTLGAPVGQLSGQATPSVNFYIVKLLVADDAFTINKIAFEAGVATGGAQYRPFVYSSNSAAVAGTLLGSGPQVTGTVAGYNEAPLTSPVAVVKGQMIWVGVNVISAAISNLWNGSGLGGFAANGGSSVPAGTAPVFSVFTTYGGVYGIWAVA